MNKKIGVFALVLLITSAIDSIRNLPTTALFGSTLIFFFVLAAIIFLLPTGLISAELSSTFKDKGGVYEWVKIALGEKFGFIAIWLQWINTMVWYPSILSFIAGTAAYLIDPSLIHNKVYLVSIILGVFWIMTLINLFGLHVSTKFASICGLIGMIVPMALIVLLAVIWFIMGEPLQIHLTAHNMLPSLSHGSNWISLTAIMASFLGMELATVHANKIDQSHKKFPKALMISMAFILITMVLGSLAIAFVLPAKQISLVAGIMQAYHAFFLAYHMTWIMPLIGVMILLGSFGGMTDWIISPAKGLLQAAQNGFLPKALGKENKHGVAGNVLITQALLVSVVCVAFLLMPSVNASYWLLTDLSTELYIMMYMLMFIAAIVIKHKYHHVPKSFKVFGGKAGTWILALLGLFGCGLTWVIGFFPPSNINMGSASHYHWVFGSGIVIMILPVFIFFWYQKKNSAKKLYQSPSS